MNSVLLTGANGLLGSNIAIELKRRNIPFYALVRPGKSTPLLQSLQAQVIEGDILDRQFLAKWVKSSDYIIHTAARTSPYPLDRKVFDPINVGLTQTLIDLALTSEIKRFVHISTANCFTNGSKENPGQEDSPFMPWLKDSGYAFSKWRAQEKILRAARENNLPAIILCPTFLIGPYDYKPSSGQLILHGLRRRVVTYPPGGKSFVAASVAAIAAVNALEKGRLGECYLLAEQHYSYREFFELLQELTGRPRLLVALPPSLLLFLGKLGTWVEKKLGWVNALTLANARMLCLPNYFTGEKARQELDMPEKSLATALQEAIDWLQENRYV